MNKSTEELLEVLKKSSLEAYLKENGGELIQNPLCDYLNAILDEKGLTKSEAIKKSNVQENYAYQIFSGIRIPSRDKLIAICFGMSLSVDEAQTLLKYAGYAPLYPRNKRDSVIIACMEKGETLVRCNIALDELNLSSL